MGHNYTVYLGWGEWDMTEQKVFYVVQLYM